MRFLFPALATFGIGVIFPIAVFIALPSPDGERSVQNNLTFSVFLLTAFPVAVGVFAARAYPTPLATLPGWLGFILRVLLAVLIVFAILMAVDDLRNPFADGVIEPHVFCDFGYALSIEKRLRAEVTLGQLTPAEARKQYLDEHLTFSSINDWIRRSSFAAKWAFALNVLAALFVVTFVWYVIVLMCWRFVGGATVPTSVLDTVFLIFGLLLTWFPMRAYAEWYTNFQSAKHLSSYSAFTVLILLAVAVAIFITMLSTPGGVAKIFTAITAGLTGALGIIGKIKPDWVRAVAEFIEGLSPISFVTVDVIVLIVFVMLALPWLA